VRLKITRPIKGSIDGIQLQDFVPGRVYDVSTTFGSYLLAEAAAVPVDDIKPAGRERVRDRAEDRRSPSSSRKRD